MKKSLIFALAAGAFLASCSSDDDSFAGGNTIDDSSRAVVKLGMAAGSVTTRGTGTVGAVEGQAGNTWSNQLVNVFMFKKASTDVDELVLATSDIAGDNDAYLYNNAVIAAPTGAEAGLASRADGEVKFYPSVGSFSFFGYYADDAVKTAAHPVENDQQKETTYALDFEIDGSQDLMVAKAPDLPSFDEVPYAMTGDAETFQEGAQVAYSAYSARREVHPVLPFQHLLTRFTFQAYAGTNTTNLYITDIKVVSEKKGTMTVAWLTENDKPTNLIKWNDGTDANNPAISWPENAAQAKAATDFQMTLKQRVTGPANTPNNNESLSKLLPVHITTAANGTAQTAASIGEALLVAPGQTKYYAIITVRENLTVQENKTFAQSGQHKIQLVNPVADKYYAGANIGEAIANALNEYEIAIDPADPDDPTQNYQPTVYYKWQKQGENDVIAVDAPDNSGWTKEQAGTPAADVTYYKLTVAHEWTWVLTTATGGVYAPASYYTKYIEKTDIATPATADKKYDIVAELVQDDATAKFQAGSSYNVLIKLASKDKIQVYTSLTAWANGGNITTTPQDDSYGTKTSPNLAYVGNPATMEIGDAAETITITSKSSVAPTVETSDATILAVSAVTTPTENAGVYTSTFTVTPGTVAGVATITINQAANADYAAAVRKFNVTVNAAAGLQATNLQLTQATNGGVSVATNITVPVLVATATTNSDGALSIVSVSDAGYSATIDQNTKEIKVSRTANAVAGSQNDEVTITVAQAASQTYAAATNQTVTFKIGAALTDPNIQLGNATLNLDKSDLAAASYPANETITYASQNAAAPTITVTKSGNAVTEHFTVAIANGKVSVTIDADTATGEYVVTISQAETAAYLEDSETLTVTVQE